MLLLQTNCIPKTHSIDYTYQSSDTMCKKKKKKKRRAAPYFHKLRMQQNMSLWCFGFSHSGSKTAALGMLSKRELIQNRQVLTLLISKTIEFEVQIQMTFYLLAAYSEPVFKNDIWLYSLSMPQTIFSADSEP